MKSKPQIACIGAGYWGINLIRNFHDIGTLAWICDMDQTRRAHCVTTYPSVPCTGDVAQALADPTVTAVAIATPAETHGALVRQALLAGKDVFVEKPLCLSAGEGRQLTRLAVQQQRILMVGHLLWYHPAVCKLRDLIEQGELGRIRYIYSNRLNLGKFRREENILWSFAPHDISVILGLVGEMPETVVAQGGAYLHDQIADVTMSALSFPSGVKAHLFVSWLHPYKEQKLVVVGDRKMAVFDDVEKEHKLLLYPHTIDWKHHVPIAHKAEAQSIPFTQSEPLRAECQHFVECIQSRQTPRTDGEEGLRVLTVLQQCQEALAERAAVPRYSPDKRCKTHEGMRRRDLGRSATPYDLSDHASTQTHSSWVDLPSPVAPTEEIPAPEAKYFAHASAFIDDPVEIGEGTTIWHVSHVMSNARIGQHCRIGQNVVIGPHVHIGNGVKIQNNVCVYEGVTLEDDVFCGPSMVFTNVINPRSEIRRMEELRPTLVQRGATLGANCTIVCGITIGPYAFIGAGAVVVRDVPAYALVVGNPGRISGWMCSCGNRINFVQEDGVGCCHACQRMYRKAAQEVTPL